MTIVSIIILGYNKPHIIEQNIEYLMESGVKKEIILIDNGSQPPLEKLIDKRDIKILRFEKGISFSAAYNAAFKIAKGKYILIINDDTFMVNKSLDKMVTFAERQDIDVLGPKLMDRNNKMQFQARRGEQTPTAMFLYGLKLYKLFPRSHTLGQYPMSYFNDDEIIPVDIISGSCMLVKREVINKVHGFDDRYTFFSEDIDLCKRIRKMGIKIYYNPFINVIHLGGESFKQVPLKFLFHIHNSYLKYAKKHFSKNIFYRVFYHLIIFLSFSIRIFAHLLHQKR